MTSGSIQQSGAGARLRRGLVSGLSQRVLWLACTAALVAGVLWLDQHRGGPASTLSRCNLLLTRSGLPAADVLIIGSSRTGTALDPVAMQQMLAHAVPGTAPTVERIALGHNPERASLGLLENYLAARGAPRVLALEIMFETERTIDRIGRRSSALSPEQTLFRRDLNLLSFAQILDMPAVAMPLTETESPINLWRYRLRGVALRAGALVYEFLRHPADVWSVSACGRDDWTREPDWPADFAFSYGELDSNAPPEEIIETLEARMAAAAPARTLASWQLDTVPGAVYPYDFEAVYRQGERALLRATIELASSHGVDVVLLPLPLYGYRIDAADLAVLTSSLPARAEVFDLYGHVQADLDRFWYDDGHIEPDPAGALTTAILARHIEQRGLLAAPETLSDRGYR